MKKLIATALSLILALGSLAACGKTETPPAETTAPAVTTPEDSAVEFDKELYYDILADENGELKDPYTSFWVEENDASYNYYEGRMFAELFDWNLDGVPELMIGYSTEAKNTYTVEFLDVYTIENGEAKKLLTADMYNDYMALDTSQSIGFSYGQDGTLYLCLYNEETYEMETYGETFYSFKDGNVDETKLYFRNENAYEGPDKFVDFRIDGTDVTEEDFNAKREELGADEMLRVREYHHEYNRLVSYLADETQIYSPDFWLINEIGKEIPEWVTEVDFGYNVTYRDGENGTVRDIGFRELTNLVAGIWLSTPISHYPMHGGDEYYQEPGEETFRENIVHYDSSSEDALAYAMFMIYNTGVNLSIHFDMIEDDEYYILYDEELPADPLGQFELTPGEGYVKLNADQVDWVLINCLNVTPDRTKTDDDFDIEYYGLFDYYYYDGYYYYDAREGGGGGYLGEPIDYVKNEDGSYTLKYSTIDEVYPEDDYNIMEVNAFIHEVDGEEIWCVNYVKDIEYISGE